MPDPHTTSIAASAAAGSPSLGTIFTGTVASSATTFLLGPIIGQYAIILGMALLGTLVALAEREPLVEPVSTWKSLWTALKFIFRGVALSAAFCSMATAFAIHMVPDSYGITPYAVMSTVAFSIGWTTDRWGSIKDNMIAWVSSKFTK